MLALIWEEWANSWAADVIPGEGWSGERQLMKTLTEIRRATF